MIIRRLLIIVLLVLCGSGVLNTTVQGSLLPGTASSPFAPASEAFLFNFSQQQQQLTLNWEIAPGYYLYRKSITLIPQGATLAPYQLSDGKDHEDTFFGKTSIYTDQLILPLTLMQASNNATLTITWQGCAAAGFCYPPETHTIPLSVVTTSPHLSAPPVASLPFSPFWALLIGIGIAFTPCVLPLYPLITGIISGGKKRLSVTRTLILTLIYVQGMAIAYTLLGIMVAAAGLPFQAALQHPYLLTGLSVLFILLALSMFGLFSLQLPASLQTRLTLWSNHHQGGSVTGVFAMGALAGLICTPCTTAPLSAILLYIAQSGNILAGGGTLYLYALGMGIPLILITAFGRQLLPRQGPWMQTVKEGFGFVILALPVFLLERVLGDSWGVRLWSLLLVSFFGWLTFALSNNNRNGWLRAAQILSLTAALGASQPLQTLFWRDTTASSPLTRISFTTIHSSDDLQQALQHGEGKVTMLDLYADWCAACKQFEKDTFSNPQVQSALSAMQRLQANVTQNNASDRALLNQLQVLGLPTILFFDASGKEIPGSRISGFLNAQAFLRHIQHIQL